MCGIAGYWVRDGVAGMATVRDMCDRMRHRGPDDEGYHVDGACAIGMRRLSIIDLNTGHQPISNEDGTVWVVFNGEIYNYRSLRQDLIARGHRFVTGSDTETLVHLYEEEGEAGVARLRGMFAYAIWDARRRRLFLARDRFGKKPLYYAETPAGFYFASELKCLRGLDIPFEIDQDALRFYFQFGHILDPATPFRAVRKLMPGHWMSREADGALRQGRYWKLPVPAEEPPPGMTEQDACVRVREIFDEAVRIRLMSDVPLGAFLSGGIDSSSVVASMAIQQPAERVKTFSIGFEEADYDETEFAALVAAKYNTEHHRITVRPDSVFLLERLAKVYDEPFNDSSSIPTFIVSEFAVQRVKVALSGDGGDELFGGYQSFLNMDRLRFADALPQALRKAISAVAAWLPYGAYGKNYLRMISRPTDLERYLDNNYCPHHLMRRLLAPEWMPPADGSALSLALRDFLAPDQADIVTKAMYFEATARLTGDMLVKVDRASMANSLEVRCPLLDHVLAEFAMSLPYRWKVYDGAGKRILLKAMRDRLPKGLLDRKKMGFAIPVARWFRGPLLELLRDHLLGKQFLERGMVSPQFMAALIEEHVAGRRDNSYWLFGLIMLELWFREWGN